MIKELLFKIKKRILFNVLENGNPDKIFRFGEKGVVPAFLNAAKRVPAYEKILVEGGVDVSEIKSLEDFKEKVPIIDKGVVFNNELSDLSVGGKLPEDFVSAFVSSGFSKKFSCGVVTEEDNKQTRGMVAMLLDYLYGSEKRKTLIVNSQGMGVTFESPYPKVDTGLRPDIVLTSLKLFGNYFDKFVIIPGTPYFAKRIIDYGVREKFDWASVDVSFIIGGDWASTSLVKYLESFGVDVRITMGLSELGLNLFHDSPVLAKVRDLAQKDKKLRYALFGEGVESCPEIVFYYPNRTFLENVNRDKNGFGELVFSMLDKKLKMPLIRYNSGDSGKLFRHEEFMKILKEQGHGDLVPEFKLPIVAVGGRKSQGIVSGGKKIGVADVREAIYRDVGVAKKLTGYFRLSKKRGALLEIQLGEGEKADRGIARKIQKEIFGMVGVNVSVKVYEYGDFPYAMKLDYENKFRFV